jgi:ketosteroid isomerase-like protein
LGRAIGGREYDVTSIPLTITLAVALAAAAGPGERASEKEFRTLMETVAAGWNAGDARRAADCFTEDAVYSEPPRKQFYRGRVALFEFFGGKEKPEPPMRMLWHHLAFDEAAQIGFGEYTFEMNKRYHGIVVVRIRDGRIANWREYQYQSPLDWEQFVDENRF